MIKRISFLLLLTLGASVMMVYGQSSGIKSPDQFLGYPLGSRFTPHFLLVDYFQYLDGQSDKMQLVEYGRTYELRPLIGAIISSPANMKRIEEIRVNNLRRTKMEEGDVTRENITFVYLSYSVHGNEAAGAESSMAVLYDLIKGGAPYDAWLENTVVIIDPSLNPDGYNRHTQWSNSFSASPNNPRPETRDHNEPWPGGRSNHYYFDLNRDWAWQTQKESRERMSFYSKWMPHVHADIHEMGAESPYYFAPAAQPYHPYVTPWQSSFQVNIGQNHAHHFDAEGWRYYTKERFDLFYPSYGDTWPTYTGAIGMTYEQGGGGYANRAVILEHGDTLTLYDRIAHHRASSLSTIEVSSRHAAELVHEFEAYYQKSVSNPPGPVRSYVIKKSNHPGRLHDLIAMLERQGIQVGMVRDERKGIKGLSYQTGEHTVFNIHRGDLLIPAAQPRAVLVQVLFEPEGKLNDSLTYDITAWSIPMAYGLDAYATEEALPFSPRYDSTRTGIPSNARPYAYALPWGSVPSSRALTQAFKYGLIARYARQEFKVEGHVYPAGTVLFMRADNRKHPSFDQAMREVTAGSEVAFSLIHTGFVESGKDLGSDEYTLVRRPEVLALSGEGMSSLNLGEIWHHFEEELKYPLHIINLDDFKYVSLEAYNVLLLTEGYYSLEDDVLEKISDWVSSGGRLIVIGSGINRVAGKDGFSITFKSPSKPDSLKLEEAAHHPDEYSSGERKALSDEIPGAVFKTQMDASHPLTFGLGNTYWTLKTNVAAYEWLGQGSNALYLDDDHHYYGFAGYNALEKIKNTLIAGQQNKGAGAVVYLVDNPMFRSFWNSGKVLFSNALFF